MKRFIIIAIIAIAFAFITLCLWFCIPGNMMATVTPNTDKIIIRYFDAVKNKKGYGEVEFNHKRHYVDYKLTCLTCHHEWKIDDSPNPHKCKSCHPLSITEPYKTVSLRNAFHRSCIKCHDFIRKESKSDAPTSCDGSCHTRG